MHHNPFFGVRPINVDGIKQIRYGGNTGIQFRACPDDCQRDKRVCPDCYQGSRYSAPDQPGRELCPACGLNWYIAKECRREPKGTQNHDNRFNNI